MFFVNEKFEQKLFTDSRPDRTQIGSLPQGIKPAAPVRRSDHRGTKSSCQDSNTMSPLRLNHKIAVGRSGYGCNYMHFFITVRFRI